MLDNSFELTTHDHPFLTEGRKSSYARAGATIEELVEGAGIPEAYRNDVQVTISKGIACEAVPRSAWARVRPTAGTHVLICPKVNGPLVGAAFAALLPSVATSLAGAAFAAGTFAFKFAVAAITVVGSLAINALIPPPSLPSGPSTDNPNFTITGSANAENRYGIYPTVLGRHLMYPPKTARGYTEGESDEIYLRERLTFGHGPVALETLRIGTTPITEFEGVEIEFLNVDQAETLKHMPELAPLVKAWRQGTEAMSLYPDDIAEDQYSVRLEKDVAVIRLTRERAVSASIDVVYPNGLVLFDGDNQKQPREETVAFSYRKLGEPDWIDAGTQKHRARSTARQRFTKDIDFGDDTGGEYEIRITRLSDDSDATTVRDDSYLSAIRSVQAGALPSHANISEMALRIKASDQLNGQIETLNAVTLQMAPVWDGTSWSAPQPVRHPAWIYARALMGPMLSRPRIESQIQLQDLLDWYTEEPHWTCDMVIDQPTQVGEVLGLICGAGRARRTLRDLKHSIIRDGGAGPVVQQFSPRNSYGFKGSITFPKEIHGFRVRCISERLEWQQDEIIVYADGYDATNATEFETLDLQGVVLGKNATNGGNAWRLGRYHLAQSVLRPETFSWYSDFEHLRVNMGDKVRLAHDVPLIGVGWGRIKSLTTDPQGALVNFTLDELITPEGSAFRVCLRKQDGVEAVFRASPPTSFTGVWKALEAVDAVEIRVGDLVTIEEVTQESMEVLIQSIYPESKEIALLTGVPAAPEVLVADQGSIPDYVPTITKVQPNTQLKPAAPRITSENIENEVSEASDGTRSIATYGTVTFVPGAAFSADEYLVYMMKPDGTRDLVETTTALSGRYHLPMLGQYTVEIFGRNGAGISDPATVQIVRTVDAEIPDDVSDLRVDVAGDQMQIKWRMGEAMVSHYRLRYLPLGDTGGWGQAQLVDGEVIGNQYGLPARSGRYLIKAVSLFGRESNAATVVIVESGSAANMNAVEVIAEEPAFAGTLGAGLTRDSGTLVLNADGSSPDEQPSAVYEFESVLDLSEVYASRVTADVEGDGFMLDNFMSSWSSLSDLESLSGVGAGAWEIEVEVSTTKDDPNGASPTWTEWAPLRMGDYVARGYKFRAILQSTSQNIAVLIRRLAVTVDMPDRVLGGKNVDCPAGGVQITYDAPFQATPTVLVEGQNLPAGAIPSRTNETRTGFHQKFEDQLGAGIACTFNWHAIGYGRSL